MNKVITVVVLLALGFGIYYFVKDKAENGDLETNNMLYSTDTEQQNNSGQTEPNITQDDAEMVESAIATIETNQGTFKVSLDGKAAPKTVANFIKLSEEGFYNNLTFHRIVRDFVIQGGDPKGDGSGGPGYTVPAEIKLKHETGAIAMARTGDDVNPTKASSGSQFYIALQPLEQLDGQYTVFGKVTSGMDVVTKIGETPTEPNPFTGETSSPLQQVIIKKITIEEKK